MADPVLPQVIRAMVVLQNANELPTDRYVTTWAFKTAGAVALATQVGVIKNAIEEFFNEVHAPALATVASFMGQQVNRATDKCHVIGYDLGEAPPRTPSTVSFTMGAAASSTPMPAEVACCLSLKSAHNGPRGRGRVYFGPFNIGAMGTPEAGDGRPEGSLVQALAKGASDMLTNGILADGGLTWSILSHVDGTTYPVTDGYVDNAWDTMRSRGLESTTRVAWT